MLTLAVPTIGTPKDQFLNEALHSAIDSPSNIVTEILISDDSRSKEFRTKLLRYKKLDQRIRIINPDERQNQVGNFNFLLDNCKTKWILYVCDDDVIYGDELEKLSASLKKDLGFISCDFDLLYDRGKKKNVCRKKGMQGILENAPKVISTLINVEKLKAVGSWREDDGYFLDLLSFIRLESLYKTEYFKINLGAFRQHGNNASSKKNRYKGYAHHLPEVIKEGYKYLEDQEQRRQFIFLVVSYSYPHFRSVTIIINKILSLLGFKAWFYK